MSITASIPIPHRRVSTRRGSVSAYDPFAVHAEINENPNRTSTSTLTIVRVAQQQVNAVPITLNEPPSSSTLSQRRIRRHPQTGPVSSPSPPADSIPGNRLSFAFSTFSGAGPAHGGPSSSPGSRDRAPSPSSSPRLRPSSPRLGPTSPFPSKPRLTPDQLVDLARQATDPRTLAQLQGNPLSGSSSPAPLSHSPVLRAHSPFGTSSSSAPATGSVAPATFTPLPDDIYLPFVDRPSEVTALISSPPDVKLFSLLAQTFPKIIDPSVTKSGQTLSLPRDPARWSYDHLIHHLTQVDRDVAPDPFWSLAARKCILSHSELLWERIKGALGIPPELDVDCDFTKDDDDSSSIDTDEISDDEGRGASGHWSDWDAVMDSPVFARSARRLSAESPAASVYFGRRERERTLSKGDQEANFRTQVEGKLQGLQKGFVQTSAKAVETPDVPTTGATTISPTPLGTRSPPSLDSAILIGSLSPPTIIQQPASPGLTEAADYISIEPLLAPPPASIPPPLSLQGALGTIGDGLGDIAEGAEEEEEAEGANADKETAPEALEDSDLISPTCIQGLRISTSPLPPSNSFHSITNTPPVLSPISPLPPYPSTQAGQSSRPHSRTSSMSSSVGPFQRSESSGNLASRIGESASYSSITYAGSDAGDSSGYTSDVGGYDSVGDRAPGNPLFPSNFARLAVGPTLRANNPNLWSPSLPPASRYGGVHSPSSSISASGGKTRTYSQGAAGLGRVGSLQRQIHRQSWGEVHEYAVSASGSSVGGSGE